MSSGPSFLGVLLEWFPLMLLLVVWMYFMRRFFGGEGAKAFQYPREQLEEMKRHNAVVETLLREIKEGLNHVEPERKNSAAS
jgi:hypothetical protein